MHPAQLFELDHQPSVTLGTPSSQDFHLKLESVPLALWLSSLQNTPHAFLVLQHADGRSWDCSASIQYFAISHIYLLFVLFLFLFFFCMACGILVPQPGIRPMPPALEAWSPDHWTTREVLSPDLSGHNSCITSLYLQLKSVSRGLESNT